MTEEEAKTKWCPMARMRESGMAEPAVNIMFGGSRTPCIASDCMMWVSDTISPEIKMGHCGLAS